MFLHLTFRSFKMIATVYKFSKCFLCRKWNDILQVSLLWIYWIILFSVCQHIKLEVFYDFAWWMLTFLPNLFNSCLIYYLLILDWKLWFLPKSNLIACKFVFWLIILLMFKMSGGICTLFHSLPCLSASSAACVFLFLTLFCLVREFPSVCFKSSGCFYCNVQMTLFWINLIS